jgi:PAS domain S-box-containing protein
MTALDILGSDLMNIVSTIAGTVADAIWLLDSRARVFFLNAAAEQLLGWTLADLEGKPVHDFLHGVSCDRAATCRLERALTCGERLAINADALLHRDGSAVLVSYTVAPCELAGNTAGTVMAFRPAPAIAEERTRELSALLEVSRSVASTMDLAPLLGLILDQLKTVVNYTGAAIFTVEADQVRMLDYQGPQPASSVLNLTIPIAEALGYQAVLRLKGPAIVDDRWATTPLGQDLQELGDFYAFFRERVPYARSFLVVPLLVKEQVIGVVRIDHAAERAYTPRHATMAMAFAGQAAMAIENARLYSQAHEMAAIEERARLARELHDSVTQMLFSASLTAEVLPSLWERDAAAGRAHLEGLRVLTRGALAEMRTLLLELRPTALTDAPLADLLRPLVDALMGRKRLRADLVIEGERPYPPEVQVALFRIAQEALNNVAKHAGATYVEVRLHSQAAGLELTVADNGQGFDPHKVGAEHFGLHIMAERAAAIGAQLVVASRPGAGTQLRVLWSDPAADHGGDRDTTRPS